MQKRATYEELEQRVKDLEKKAVERRWAADATIELTIEDNGQGFHMEGVLSLNSSHKGFGITSMKERTELSEGSFLIESTAGAGTRCPKWPLFRFGLSSLRSNSALCSPQQGRLVVKDDPNWYFLE